MIAASFHPIPLGYLDEPRALFFGGGALENRSRSNTSPEDQISFTRACEVLLFDNNSL